jgi:hypothetical protein
MCVMCHAKVWTFTPSPTPPTGYFPVESQSIHYLAECTDYIGKEAGE